jgi:hypothetical protein
MVGACGRPVEDDEPVWVEFPVEEFDTSDPPHAESVNAARQTASKRTNIVTQLLKTSSDGIRGIQIPEPSFNKRRPAKSSQRRRHECDLGNPAIVGQ